MDDSAPFQRSDDLDLQVRTLLRAMLEPVTLKGRDELLAQIPRVSVVGRFGLDCLLQVESGTAPAPISSGVPVVCAPVDAEPEQAEIYGEPYVGQLELIVRDGFFHILVYSPWCFPTKLPDPVDIHPTAETTGYVVVDEFRYMKGWSSTRGVGQLYHRE